VLQGKTGGVPARPRTRLELWLGEMLLEIYYGEKRIPVELKDASGVGKILLDGREVWCDYVKLQDGNYSLIIEGQVYDIFVEVSDDACSVSTRQGVFRLRIADHRRIGAGDRGEVGVSGLQRMVAEMPGKVIRLLCKVGDEVAFDQGLLIIEAMKMQNEIRAPKSGVVKEIGVEEGKAVNSGDFLVSLE
jgi:biotin carboxyl carrier protein